MIRRTSFALTGGLLILLLLSVFAQVWILPFALGRVVAVFPEVELLRFLPSSGEAARLPAGKPLVPLGCGLSLAPATTDSIHPLTNGCGRWLVFSSPSSCSSWQRS